MVKVADQSAVVSDAVSGFIRVLIEAVLSCWRFHLSRWVTGRTGGGRGHPAGAGHDLCGMMLAGIGLQRISLGALIIALGLLVDDAMIAVETWSPGWKPGIPVGTRPPALSKRRHFRCSPAPW
jgi:multidrug efflux pump subunit AcrB